MTSYRLSVSRLIRATILLRTLLGKFLDDRCTTYAAALAFSSMLSIIPCLAIVFAILKAFNVHTALTPVILANISVGSHEVVLRMLRYIHNTSVTSLGIVGLVTLVFSIMTTLDTVEEAFNRIWGIPRGKAYRHKLRDYLIVILGTPLLLAVAATITTTLQHHSVTKWLFTMPGGGPLLLLLFRVAPFLSIWLALFFLYVFIPNVRVHLPSALAGSVVAGTIGQLAQWVYIHFQIGVSRANAIYGTMALLPVFMIWIYTGWMIVLAGMELVCYLHGSAGAGRDGAPRESGVAGGKIDF